MTPETNSAGPQQVGEVGDAAAAAALAAEAVKAGISMPPQPDGEGEVVKEGAPSGDEAVGDDAPPRPEWLPEKFKSVEDMAKAYSELEKQQGTKPGENQQDPKAGEQAAQSEATKQAADIVQKAGLEWPKLNEEWSTGGGKLSDASYEAFAKQGVSKDLVNGFIEGQIAIATTKVNEVRSAAFETAGGEAKYMEAIEWAKGGWSASEIKAFDKAVSGSDAAAVKLAVSGLMSAFTKGGGAEPTNVARTTRATQGVYQNVEQMINDMQDPRYESDPAFRDRVAQKLSRSSI